MKRISSTIVFLFVFFAGCTSETTIHESYIVTSPDNFDTSGLILEKLVDIDDDGQFYFESGLVCKLNAAVTSIEFYDDWTLMDDYTLEFIQNIMPLNGYYWVDTRRPYDFQSYYCDIYVSNPIDGDIYTLDAFLIANGYAVLDNHLYNRNDWEYQDYLNLQELAKHSYKGLWRDFYDDMLYMEIHN